jgi:hypothetical protein
MLRRHYFNDLKQWHLVLTCMQRHGAMMSDHTPRFDHDAVDHTLIGHHLHSKAASLAAGDLARTYKRTRAE